MPTSLKPLAQTAEALRRYLVDNYRRLSKDIDSASGDLEASIAAIDARLTTVESAYSSKTLYDAKGDILVGSGADAVGRLPVGANTNYLTADSAESLGVKWVADTNVKNTLADAKGDLIVGSANDAFSRLAIGANDAVLIADSAQSLGLKWGTRYPVSGVDYAYQYVSTSQARTLTTFGDLATVGPQVTLTTGTIVKISLSCWCGNTTANDGCLMSFAVSSATTRAAVDAEGVGITLGTGNNTIKGGHSIIIAGLTAGSNVFTAKYRAVTGGSATFLERFMLVERMN